MALISTPRTYASEDSGSGTGGGAFWAGWFGAGGYNAHKGGRGTGGCGGGGSANGSGNAHKGGGGGGGSVAAKATIDASTIAPDLINGEPDSKNGLTSQVVVTFELKTKS